MFKNLFQSFINRINNERGELEIEVDREELIIKQANEEIEAESEGREPKDFLSKPQKKEDEEIPEEEKPPVEPKIDEQKPEDEQTEEEKAKLAEEAEANLETKTPEEEAEIAKEILEHSQRHSMTEAEAKEDIAKTTTIIEQFKNDPKEMARALRSKDREYDKLKNETEKRLKETKPLFVALNEDEFRKESYKAMKKDEDKYLVPWKERYPSKSEFLSDDAILEEILDRDWMTYSQTYAPKQEAELREKADSKRKEVLSLIPKEDSRFLPDIQEMLKNIPVNDVLSEHFSEKALLFLAKGKNFDTEIKEAEERGFKRGKEGTSILGVKEGGSQRPSNSSKSQGSSLNKQQKERAVQMFGNNTDEDNCYRLFRETFEEELKENPKFL